jgi:membrane-bound lytic murein transglycosylase F
MPNPGPEQSRAMAASDSLIREIVNKIHKKQELSLYSKQLFRQEVQRKISFYEPIIKKYSKRYSLDWRLVVAQILQESRFEEKSISPKGARGLMQIMPRTAREIRKEIGIKNIPKNPKANIIGGIYHLAKQIRYFPDADPIERIKLSLAAYNCGAGHVFDAQEICRFHHWNHREWKFVSRGLTQLTPDYYTIHLQIWPNGVPRYGYFYNYQETLTYVSSIMNYYEVLKEIL